MKKAILILTISLFTTTVFAQTKKGTPCDVPAAVKAPKPDSVKVSSDELKGLITFMSNLVNHSSDLSGKELNGDGKTQGDIGINGQLAKFYNTYFPQVAPIKKQ